MYPLQPEKKTRKHAPVVFILAILGATFALSACFSTEREVAYLIRVATGISNPDMNPLCRL